MPSNTTMGRSLPSAAHVRFEAACRHRLTDRVPIDYMAPAHVTRKLLAFFGASSERELLDRLGSDFYYLSGRDISQNETCLAFYRGPKLDMTDTERTCPFGIRYRRGVFADKFGADEVAYSPLAAVDSAREVLAHPMPDPRWFDVDALLPECEAFADRVVVGGFWTAIFGNSYRLMGLDRFLMNMALKPKLVHSLVDRMTEFYLALNDRLFTALRGRMHVYFLGNDWGTQKGLMFSRAMWFDFFFENYCRLIALAKSHGLRVMTHSCGAIRPLIDPLIEAGVDILDPVQTSAAGMASVELKEEFGSRLVFHGAVDTQRILPRGTPDDVARHVAETIAVLGSDGGYICCSCNNIQSDAPVENIDAMYRAAREHVM